MILAVGSTRDNYVELDVALITAIWLSHRRNPRTTAAVSAPTTPE